MTTPLINRAATSSDPIPSGNPMPELSSLSFPVDELLSKPEAKSASEPPSLEAPLSVAGSLVAAVLILKDRFYSDAVANRLEPFFNETIDFLEEKRRQAEPNYVSFLTKATSEFSLKFPSELFDPDSLLEEYLNFAMKRMNGKNAVRRFHINDQMHLESLTPEELKVHIDRMTLSLKDAVKIDFNSRELDEGELKLKIEKELDKFYQGLMWADACMMALEVSRSKAVILSWKADDWKKGFCEAVETKFQRKLEPVTRTDIGCYIDRLLAAREALLASGNK